MFVTTQPSTDGSKVHSTSNRSPENPRMLFQLSHVLLYKGQGQESIKLSHNLSHLQKITGQYDGAMCNYVWKYGITFAVSRIPNCTGHRQNSVKLCQILLLIINPKVRFQMSRLLLMWYRGVVRDQHRIILIILKEASPTGSYSIQ